MDKTVRKFDSLDEMKIEEYRDWQSRPAWERIEETWRLSCERYGVDPNHRIRPQDMKVQFRKYEPGGDR